VLFSESAMKGRTSSSSACQRGVPILFLQNITGFIVGRQYEQGGIRQGRREDGARRRQRRSCEDHGDRRRLVRRRQLRNVRPRLPAALPLHVAELEDLGDGRRASRAGARHREDAAARRPEASLDEKGKNQISDPIVEKFDREGSPYYSTSRLWDDGILDPRGDARRARTLDCDCSRRADAANQVRRISDVSMFKANPRRQIVERSPCG